jgi:cytochrome c-type biogenesis protein CcmE
MTRKQRRLTLIGGALVVLAIAAGLVLNALRDSIVFFSTPTMAAEKQIKPGQRFRLGGMVREGSLVRGEQLKVKFDVTDGNATLPVAYRDSSGPVPRRTGRDYRRRPRRQRLVQGRHGSRQA